MQFLSDIFILCPDCKRPPLSPAHPEIKIERGFSADPDDTLHPRLCQKHCDVLDSTVGEAIVSSARFHGSKPAHRAVEPETVAVRSGWAICGYCQPSTRYHGGESPSG